MIYALTAIVLVIAVVITLVSDQEFCPRCGAKLIELGSKKYYCSSCDYSEGGEF